MAADPYTLPADDPCHSTWEAFKYLAGPGVDASWQALRYQQYPERITAWQQCCPALREKTVALRPATPGAAELQDFELPGAADIFSDIGVCGHVIPFKGAAGAADAAMPQLWYRDYNRERAAFWDQAYARLTDELQACCHHQLSGCRAGIRKGLPQKTAAATEARCVRRGRRPAAPLLARQQRAAAGAGVPGAAPAHDQRQSGLHDGVYPGHGGEEEVYPPGGQ